MPRRGIGSVEKNVQIVFMPRRWHSSGERERERDRESERKTEREGKPKSETSSRYSQLTALNFHHHSPLTLITPS